VYSGLISLSSAANKQKNILLIPVQDNLSHLGVRYLHYTLLENGFRSNLLFLPYLDLNDSNKAKKIVDFISRMNPLYVGLSLTSLVFNNARDLSIFLKKHFPELTIIWGGVHPTIDPESCMPYADYVMLGESEKSIIDFSSALTSGKDIKDVPNLCYQENGQIKKNPLCSAIEDLDTLPWFDHISKNSYVQRKNGRIYVIDRDVYHMEGRFQGRVYEMLSSRGCAFSCTYCTNNFFNKLYPSNKKVRRRSIENIIGELEQMVKNDPEIELVVFHDESFLICSTEYIRKFCETYKEKINKPFLVRVTPTSINKEKLILLKEAGVSWVSAGLQSGSDEVNKKVYNRHAFKKDFMQAANLLKELNIASKYDVILDNPFENESNTIETIETLIETPKPYIVEFFSLTFLPGTELYDRAQAECPEKMEDCKTKDYMGFKKSYLNKLTVLAVYLPQSLMIKLLQLYRTDSNGSKMFKFAFNVSSLLSAVYYKPKTLIRLLKLSRENSYVKAAKMIPLYIKDYFAVRNF